MKQVLKSLTLLLALSAPSAGQSIATADEPEIIPVHTNNPVDANSPRPRQIVVEPKCYYWDGYVYIECDGTIISGTVTRIEDNVQWNGNAGNDMLVIQVTSAPGSYRLTFSLSDGRRYIGTYTR